MTSILVTGANGQLGSEIRDISGNFKNFHFYLTDVDTLDITNVVQLKSFFNCNKIDYVINCAAYTEVDKAESEKTKADSINVMGVRNLVQLCTNFKSRLIHISTDYVFDGLSVVPYKENDEVNPQGCYGRSKLAGETEARRFTQAIILRTSWLFSSYGKNFVKTILKLGRDRGEVSVVNDQTGCPTYAFDLAGAILTIIDHSVRDTNMFKPGVYHYSNEGECNWCEFAQEIFSSSGILCNVTPIATKDFPTAARRPAYSVMDKSKFKSAFNITIPHWKESLSICLPKIKI